MFQSHFAKFVFVLLSLYLILKFICSIACVFTLIGYSLVLFYISFQIATWWHFYYDQEFVSSYEKAVLITGCSSGFGKDLALKLNAAGFTVFAGTKYKLKPKSDLQFLNYYSCLV